MYQILVLSSRYLISDGTPASASTTIAFATREEADVAVERIRAASNRLFTIQVVPLY